MQKTAKRGRVHIALTLLLCGTVYLILCAVRVPSDDVWYWDGDAPNHVLLTMRAYQETPVSVHKFVPLVTLGAPEDKWMQWGSALADEGGRNYYTSFSAASFAPPYVLFRLLGIPATLQTLYWFNRIFYGACAAMTALIMAKQLKRYAPTWFLIAAATLLYLCPMEIQHAQGVAYWAQSVFQLGFLFQVWCFLHRKKTGGWLAFLALCIVMPYVEWTGYIANVGFALTLLAKPVRQALTQKTEQASAWRAVGKACVPVGIIALCTVAAFGLFAAHYLLVLDAQAFWEALQERFFARTGARAQLGMLLLRYWRGFAPQIVLTALAVMAAGCLPAARKKMGQLLREQATLLFVFSFPLLENVVMLGHATMYTYDLIKSIWVLELLFFLGVGALLAAYPVRKRAVLAGASCGMALACAVAVLHYNVWPNTYYCTAPELRESRELAQYINARYPTQTARIANQRGQPQRGWENLTFGRNVCENLHFYELKLRAANEGWKHIVMLNVNDMGFNYYEIPSFEVYDVAQNTTTLYHWKESTAIAIETTQG